MGGNSSVKLNYARKGLFIMKIGIAGPMSLELLKKELPIILVALFGSYAKGNYTVASDVDLLVVYKGEEIKNAFAAVKKTVAIPRLEPHVYSESEYEELKDSISRMIEDGVVLFRKDGAK